MELTQIIIRKMIDQPGERMRAIVSVVFDDMLALHDLKIIDRDDRFFVAMPSKMWTDGQFRDTAHPITCAFREKLEKKIVDFYLLHRDYEYMVLMQIQRMEKQYGLENISLEKAVETTAEYYRAPRPLIHSALRRLMDRHYVRIDTEHESILKILYIKADWEAIKRDGLLIPKSNVEYSVTGNPI